MRGPHKNQTKNLQINQHCLRGNASKADACESVRGDGTGNTETTQQLKKRVNKDDTVFKKARAVMSVRGEGGVLVDACDSEVREVQGFLPNHTLSEACSTKIWVS